MTQTTPLEDFAGALRARLAAPDPDAALIAFRDAVLDAADLIGTQAETDQRGKSPIAGLAAVLLTRAFLRSGAPEAVAPFLSAFAVRWAKAPPPAALERAPWLAARVSGQRPLSDPEDALDYLRISYPYLEGVFIELAAARGDQAEFVSRICAFASYRRQKNDARGQGPLAADIAERVEAERYGPFRYDPGFVLEKQLGTFRLGPLDGQLETVRAFEALALENALLSRQPARVLPLIDERLEAHLSGPIADGEHFVFNAICVLSVLGAFDRALDAARRLIRRGYGLPWRFLKDRSDRSARDWTREMGQDEWLALLHALPAYDAFLAEYVLAPPSPPEGPALTPPCAVHDGVLGGKASKRCFISGKTVVPGTGIVRVRRLRGISAESDFNLADKAAFEASDWQAARVALETCTMPVDWLFPDPRLQHGTWDSPHVAAFCFDVARAPQKLDIRRAVDLLAAFEPPPMRFLWTPERYQWREPFAPCAGDDMHGDAARLAWRLVRTGHGAEMLRHASALPQIEGDKLVALLATFDIPDLRAGAARHFGLPDLPEIMHLVFASRLTFEDHLRLADYGSAHPRFRAAMVAAMRAYGVHLYSNSHVTVDWFLQGLEHYAYAHGCQLLFFLIHHPQEDPVLAKVLETGWLPRNHNTYDGYDNAAPFYLRAAMFHVALHQPDALDVWVDSARLRDISTMAKDRETFRLMEAHRKKKAGRRKTGT